MDDAMDERTRCRWVVEDGEPLFDYRDGSFDPWDDVQPAAKSALVDLIRESTVGPDQVAVIVKRSTAEHYAAKGLAHRTEFGTDLVSACMAATEDA